MTGALRRSAAIVLLGLGVAHAAPSDPGNPDPTFNSTGFASNNGDSGADGSAWFGVAAVSGSRTVVAGTERSASGAPTGFAIRVFGPDGRPDTAFNTSGKRQFVVGIASAAYALAVQPDGNYLLAGEARSGSSLDIALARLTPAGAFDSAFGSSGQVVLALSGGDDVATSVALQADGRIVVGGTTNSGASIFLLRLLASGGLDTTFGAGGVVFVALDGAEALNKVVVQSDGKILAVGSTTNLAGVSRIVMLRYLANGSPDTSFGNAGRVLHSIRGFDDEGHDIALQADGRIVVAGTSRCCAPDAGKYDMALLRFNAGGTPDTTFGTNGLVLTTVRTGHDQAIALRIQPDGRIVIVGESQDAGGIKDAVVARYRPDGSLDTRFGGSSAIFPGVAIYMVGSSDDVAWAVDLQADGRILVSGEAAGYGAFVMRLYGDSAAVADLSGDLKSDLLWQDAGSGPVQGWLMDGLNVTEVASLLPAGYDVTHLADLNGDGTSDLLIRALDGSVTGILMQGLTSIGQGTLLPAGSGWSITKVADFNGDGRADLVLQHTDGTVQAWIMNGHTVVSSATFAGAGSGWSVVHVADLDGNGRSDLIWRHTDGSVQAWVMDGFTVLGVASFVPAATGWAVKLVADFNGDGKSDLMWQHADGSTQAWLMNGTTVTSVASYTTTESPWSPRLAGDLDGNGTADLFWESFGGGSQTWLMSGLQVAEVASFVPPSSGWRITHLLDLNGDGRRDAIWAHEDGSTQAWLMNGLAIAQIGSFTGPGTYRIVP